MPEITYNVEFYDTKKWFYIARAWSKEYAIGIASRHGGSKMRIRKVVKTVVWKSKKEKE